ncbi:MAG: pyridoxal phosphate-dependent aminotransferase [Synergistaceae bacterium]|nr:pyridoxal phosphate-dependent aminotransferase [Synergistaceae bacterium]MBQ3346123.1 pyridoxal phosphate-dependent aminotransferase [Synergistaceae bacterium]MBQ3399336.1 pyridoxal phosphate-dependent aminotransferase [Synergistaceae bacterium]MBQ3759512.1 pyridoxal phosphate-dependent aminotransferase [Synergistaceae bacterium]MBQ4402404.1 pyridoxal phosphate-dependent aminotransferase [Synergistaceae bacterium]
MKYDFETVRKRFNTGSKKWGEMKNFGVKESEDIIPFSVADMEFVTPPEIVEAIKRELDVSIMGYENPTPEYLDTVCSWMKDKHNWDARPEWILPSHGVVDAFFQTVKTYTNEGDGVMLMTPVYYPMYHAVNFNRRTLVDNQLVNKGDHYEIDFDDFERKASDPNTKMLILCSPHNPAGRVWTREELERIGNICLKHGVLVVSDEIHFDLIMPGHVHTVYASISEEFAQNCLVLTAPSKTFNVAGLQTSNIFIPNPELREKFLSSLKLSNPNPKCNILGYVACEAAYKHCGEWLNECLKVIDSNRKAVCDFMAREFPAVKVYDLEGTYLLWMDFNDLGLDYRELERINHEEARLFFDEGYVFGKQGEGFERWNLACPSRYIHEALERMKSAYKNYV